MGANFAQRRALYGDAVIGASNLRMVAIAASCGCNAKFAGSGGTGGGVCREEQSAALRDAFEVEGFIFARVQPKVPAGKSAGEL